MKIVGIYCYKDKETGKTKYGKQRYSIKMNGKFIKYSINPSKLLDWFTKEYPSEILILNNIF